MVVATQVILMMCYTLSVPSRHINALSVSVIELGCGLVPNCCSIHIDDVSSDNGPEFYVHVVRQTSCTQFSLVVEVHVGEQYEPWPADILTIKLEASTLVAANHDFNMQQSCMHIVPMRLQNRCGCKCICVRTTELWQV